MGKAAKKKAAPKAFDARGVATTSIRKPKTEEEPAEEEQPATPAATASAAPAATAEKDAAGAAEQAEGLEEWEIEAEKAETRREQTAQASTARATPDAKAPEMDEEEWEKVLESRLDEELAKVIDKRAVPVDTSSQLERKPGGQPPAGAVAIGKAVEQKMLAALEHQRDEEGTWRMIFPKSWRYKGKLTYERLNGIYLGLESFKFSPSQIKWAMTSTLGHDFRAAFEFLLMNLPREQLPKQLGGEGTEDAAATEAAAEDAGAQPVEVAEEEAEAKADAPAETEEKGPELEDGPDEEAQEEEPAKQKEAISGGSNGNAQASSAGADSKDFTKQWLAQYCEEDSDSDGLLSPEERLEKERLQDPTARYIKVSKQFDDASRVARTLKEKKKQSSFKQNVSADMQKQKEASEKMRTCRAELESLESGKYGKLDMEAIAKHKAASSAGSKAQSKKAAEAPPKEEQGKEANGTPTAAEKEAEGQKPSEQEGSKDEDLSELPDLFDDNAVAAAAGGSTEANDEGLIKPKRSYKMTGWTGRTPKQALEDFVLKFIFVKPPKGGGALVTYTKVTDAKCRGYHRSEAVVKQPRGQPAERFSLAPEDCCDTAQEAEHLAAAFALYRLSQDADRTGLVRGLPPAFRDRVKEWEQEAADRARAMQRSLVKTRVEFVEGLLRTGQISAPAIISDDTSAQDVAASATPAETGENAVDFSTDTSERLRADFHARRRRLGSNAEWLSIQEARARLPVADHRERMLAMIEGSGVSIVSGATGSGKTTQVPQFVLEAALEADDGSPLPNIVVTEPRRISATSVARRVSKEIGDPAEGPGARHSLVGYQIRLERKATDNTRLLFCTVGVLLRRLQLGRGSISGVTHVFVDEVHERSAECDLLMLLLRQLRITRPEVRVILMSATMDTDKLRGYFGGHSVPYEAVPGRTFPVQDFWLEDAVEITGYYCEEDGEFAKRGWKGATKVSYQVSAGGGKTQQLVDFVDDDEDEMYQDVEGCEEAQYSGETQRTLMRMDHSRINFDLIELLLECIEDAPQFQDVARDEGAVLIFLPGLMEITKLHDRLLRTKNFGNSSRCCVISLHSVLSGEDQARAFDRPPQGVRKIVLSTNIAETGVTIPDVVYVIDAGKVKNMRYHEASNTSSLKECFVSCAEVMQRRGRAGRVREGVCFHLMTRRRYQKRLQQLPVPEILRCSLMELALSVLSSGMQPICFLEALDPPPKARIDQAMATLRATGAVEEVPRPAHVSQIGAFDEAYYAVTPVGQCLARMPCDVRLGKMVLLAALFGGVEPVWTIAATLSHRSPLVTPFSESKRQLARQAHVAHFLQPKEPPSDHSALNSAYVQWEENRKNRHAETFCRKSYLSHPVLQAISDIRRDLVETLEADGFWEQYGKSEVLSTELRSPQMVAALTFAGLYPNVARVDAPKTASEQLPVLSAGSELLKVHPGSLCHNRTDGLHRTNCRWICYHERVKTWQTFLRDCTFLAPNALLLFGGDPGSINIHPLEKSVTLGSSGDRQWQAFYLAPRAAVLTRQLRYVFDAMLRRKASDPKQPLSEKDRKVVLAYIAVINAVQ